MDRSVIIVTACIALLLAACGNEASETEDPRLGFHPVPEHIPHYTNDHVVVDREQSIDALDDVPQPIVLLADYLEDPASVDVEELETLVAESPWHFRVTAIDESRLALVTIVRYAELEPRVVNHGSPRLVEYDLRTHEYVDHTEADLDIGHLRQMPDMKHRAGVLYVAHNPMEISRFDCSSAPCTYDSTESFRSVDIVRSPRAIAPVTDSTLAVFSAMRNTVDLPFTEHFEDIVKVFDDEHNLVKAFGSAYSAGMNAVNSRFFRYVGLEYSESAAQFALIFQQLPYLYAYDEEGQLRATYQFDTEIEPVVEDTGRRGPARYNWLERNPRRSYYLLIEMDGLAVVVRESIEREDPDDEEAAYRYDYHAIDLMNEETYHIGRDTYEGTQERLVFVTEAGLVLHDGEALYFIEP